MPGRGSPSPSSRDRPSPDQSGRSTAIIGAASSPIQPLPLTSGVLTRRASSPPTTRALRPQGPLPKEPPLPHVVAAVAAAVVSLRPQEISPPDGQVSRERKEKNMGESPSDQGTIRVALQMLCAAKASSLVAGVQQFLFRLAPSTLPPRECLRFLDYILMIRSSRSSSRSQRSSCSGSLWVAGFGLMFFLFFLKI